MRFLGVHPGPLLYSKIFLRLEPLGLELVAQAARRAGHTVRLIDLQVEDHAAFFRLVDSWRPDIVAFSCNYLANIPEIVDLPRQHVRLRSASVWRLAASGSSVGHTRCVRGSH